MAPSLETSSQNRPRAGSAPLCEPFLAMRQARHGRAGPNIRRARSRDTAMRRVHRARTRTTRRTIARGRARVGEG
eukprot:3594945-Pyramimonas_sp.AAC.1